VREELKRTPILKPALVILAFVVVFGIGVLVGEVRTPTLCAICEKPLPLFCEIGTHEACLQARIEQCAWLLDPMAGKAGMEEDGRPRSDER